MARRYNIDNYLIEMSASEAEQILGLSGKYSASEVKSSYRKTRRSKSRKSHDSIFGARLRRKIQKILR